MNKIKLVIVILIVQAVTLKSQNSNFMWFDKPAQYFEETIVLGNGKMGASVFGGTEKETIYLNDATLWSGEPVNANMNPDAYKHLPEIREALYNENYKLADKLNQKLQGSFSQSYAPLGTAYIHFNHNNISNYRRELDLSKAISKIT